MKKEMLGKTTLRIYPKENHQAKQVFTPYFSGL